MVLRKPVARERQLLFRGSFWKEVRRNPLPKKVADKARVRRAVLADDLMELYRSLAEDHSWLERELRRRGKSLVDIAETKASMNAREQEVREKEEELRKVEKLLKLVKLKEKYAKNSN